MKVSARTKVSKHIQSLTMGELLTLVLGTGSNNRREFVLSHYVLQAFSLERLRMLEIGDLVTIPGIGPMKAKKILAAIEFGRRIWKL